MSKRVHFLAAVAVVAALFVVSSSCKGSFERKVEATPETRNKDASKNPVKTEAGYAEIIKKETPFKELVWSNEFVKFGGVKRASLKADQIFIETLDKEHLFALDASNGITQWIFKEGELMVAPGIMDELPALIASLTKEKDEMLAQYEEIKNKKGVSQTEIDQLKVSVMTTQSKLNTKRTRDVVYLITGMKLFAVSRNGGLRLWDKPLKFIPSSDICVSDTVTYIPAFGNQRIFMNNNLDPTIVNPAWYATTGSLTSSVAFSDPYHYYATDKNMIFAMLGAEVRWKYKVENRVSADLVLAKVNDKDTFLIVASTDYAVYALNKNTGFPEWKKETGAPITTTPVVSGGRVYALSDNNALFCLSLKDGKEHWRSEEYVKFLARGSDRVYLYDKEGNICSVDDATGKKLMVYPKPDKFDFVFANPETCIVYFVAQDGFIYAATESRTQY